MNTIKIDHEYSCVWFEECDYLMKHGIRFNNVDEVNSDSISVKYRGEIGKPNFSCEL